MSLDPHELAALLVALHFLGDFGGQWPWLAKVKGETVAGLLLHVAIYGLLALVPLLVLFGSDATSFVVLNLASHLAIDAVTSRVTKRLYPVSQFWFWKVIAMDQLAHIGLLLLTMPRLYS